MMTDTPCSPAPGQEPHHNSNATGADAATPVAKEAPKMQTDTFAPGEAPKTTTPTGPADIKLEVIAPERPRSSRLAALFSALVSLAMLVAVAMEARDLNLAQIIHMIPRQAPFWLAFAAYYLIPPLTEWVIYRRLWGLPFSGIAALLRKLVSNELLLGYLGEVQFYAWARGRLNMVTAPFGAIKDVTILSALTGNISTLVMLAAAWQWISDGAFGKETSTVFTSLGVVLLTSFIILLFRQKLFTLPRRELWLITGIHFARILAFVGLSALMWHFVLPNVAYGLWLVLATLRMLISRLPLLPNKDVVFAGIAVLLLGQEAEIASLMAMMAGLLLITHLIVGTVFASADLIIDIFNPRSEG